jgi:CubicO group peptidase (beta-lactamase class C family)
MMKRFDRMVRSLMAALVGIVAIVAGAGCPPPAIAAPQPAQGMGSACQNPAPLIAGAGGAVTQSLAAALQGLPSAIAPPAAQLPSLAVAVVLDQQVIFAAGIGCADIAMGTPATPQTVYKIESITKVFEATMAMQQRDAGRYQLTDTVDNYVPQSTTR